MGVQRLPRDPAAQKTWARRLTAGLRPPPIGCFAEPRQTRSSFFRSVFFQAYTLGAEAALREVIEELNRPDDPCAGLPPYLCRAVEAAKRARQARAEREKAEAEAAEATP